MIFRGALAIAVASSFFLSGNAEDQLRRRRELKDKKHWVGASNLVADSEDFFETKAGKAGKSDDGCTGKGKSSKSGKNCEPATEPEKCQVDGQLCADLNYSCVCECKEHTINPFEPNTSTSEPTTPSVPTPLEPTPSEPTPSEPTPSVSTPLEPTPSEPTPSEPSLSCSVPDEGRCNGIGHLGCNQCVEGSGCVYKTPEESICLPGYTTVDDNCVLDDRDMCGGLGYSGCQICKPGSECVVINQVRSICLPEGTGLVDDTPIMEDESVRMAGSWVKGIDPDLDEQIANMDSGSTSTMPLDEMRSRISTAFASSEGLEMARSLMISDASFRQFNDEKASQLQDEFCNGLQSPDSAASVDVKDCICGTSDKPFVHCAAMLEQEATAFVAQRARERRGLKEQVESQRHLRSWDADGDISRQLQKCQVNIEGVTPGDTVADNKLNKYAIAVVNQVDQMDTGAGDFCAGESCSVPLAPLPLSASVGISSCIPTLGALQEDPVKNTLVDVRRAAAFKTTVTIYAQVCVLGADANEDLLDLLKFIGINLCPIRLDGTIRSLVGLVEASVTASLLIFYAKGTFMYMYDDAIRDSLALCEGISECAIGKNEDCAMCGNDMFSKIELGIKFLFFTKSFSLGLTNDIKSCINATSDGQCQSGLDTSCWDDGTVCAPGISCGSCCNEARDALGFKCGGECWEDGTICGVGTTCNFCCNTAFTDLGTKCGGECWEDGTICGAGTTCNNCCNPAFTDLGTKCGGECWEDGTVCGVGTTCNNCCNGSSFWFSLFITACGSE